MKNYSFYRLVIIGIFISSVIVSCKKENTPQYSMRMHLICDAPWRWSSYHYIDSAGTSFEITLDSCMIDNYYTFTPYDDDLVPEIMRINYGSNLCSPDEVHEFMTFDYWGFFENETKIRASGWGNSVEPGKIITLNKDTLRILYEPDSLNVNFRELILIH